MLCLSPLRDRIVLRGLYIFVAEVLDENINNITCNTAISPKKNNWRVIFINVHGVATHLFN